MTDALEDHEGTVSIGGRSITNLCFVDDFDGLAGEEEELAKLVEHLDKASTAYSMEISAEKTKLMTNTSVETVTSFKYLGSVITDEGSKPEILSRIAQTTEALTRLKTVCNDRGISLSSVSVLSSAKKNISHGNEVLQQDTMHLMQRPCNQQGSPCQDPAVNRTTRRPDHRKKTQTAVVWTCLPFIRSGQNLLASHSERGTKTRQTEEEVGRLHQGMDRPGVRRVPEGSGVQRTQWRKLVVKSSEVPQRPSRLRDG